MNRIVGSGSGLPVVLCALLILAAAPLAAEQPISARAFEIQHHSLTDAAELVSPLLSDRGELTLRMRQKTLVVQDEPAILDRVASMLDSWDLPPRNVEFTLTVFLGSRHGEDSSVADQTARRGIREARGVLNMVGDVTKWDRYESLGTRSVIGSKGHDVSAVVSERYRVLFVVDSVHEESKRVKFKLSLFQKSDGPGGHLAQEILELATGMTLAEGRPAVVGAAKDPTAPEALFLAVQVKLR